MFLLGIILLPVRALLVGIILLLAWPFAVISTACCPEKLTHPISNWRRKITRPALTFLARAMFFSMGFTVTVKGKVASPLEAPIFVVAPHSTFFDGIACVVAGLPSLVSRNENAQTPLVGRAFIPGVPVQPVLLRYPNKLDTVTWTWQGYTFLQLCVLTFCQLFTKVEIEFMPVQAPSEEEKNDPVLFASRIRNLMAEALEIPVTDHTYEDCRLMISAGQLTLPMEAGLVEFSKISRKLKLDWDGIRKHLDEYASIASSSKGGRIGIEEFAEYLKLPVSDVLRQLFALFDRLFDVDEDGYITEEEFCTILQASLGVPDLNVSGLFREIAQRDSVSYEEFKSFALKHPEYAKIFTTYLDLQTCHVFSLPEEVQTAPSVASNKVSPESQEEGTSDKKVD